jgi:hypothetical protein
MPRFLSDEWFDAVQELNESVPDMRITRAMKDVVVNLVVSSDRGEIAMCMHGGLMRKGHDPGPDVTMTMPAEYAFAILVRGEWSAGMKGWVKRKIRVSGNMRKLIPLQTHDPTPDQEALRKRIEAITE